MKGPPTMELQHAGINGMPRIKSLVRLRHGFSHHKHDPQFHFCFGFVMEIGEKSRKRVEFWSPLFAKKTGSVLVQF